MDNEKTISLFVHLSGLALFLSIPFANIIGPLVLWLIFRERSEFVNANGKEALNFQISFTIYFIVSGILVLLVIGIFMLIAAGIVWLIFVIVATVRAGNGEMYRYPLTIRFIK